MLRLSVHVIRLTVSTATLQEEISLSRESIRSSAPSFLHLVLTVVHLVILIHFTIVKDMHIHTLMPKQWFDVFLVKTWKSTRKSVLFRKLSAHINVGQQRYLTSHVETECPYRKVDCQYCHITGEHQFIEGEHKEQCPKLPISCLNKCGVGSLPREDMEAHRKECPLEMVQCAYHNVGCEERMTGKDLEFHKWRNIYH